MVTLQCGGECARIVGILRVKKAYLEETISGLSVSSGRAGGVRSTKEATWTSWSSSPRCRGSSAFSGSKIISPRSSEERWTWSKRAHSNPVSVAVSGKRFCIYDPHGGVPSIMGTISLTEDRDLHRGYAVRAVLRGRQDRLCGHARVIGEAPSPREIGETTVRLKKPFFCRKTDEGMGVIVTVRGRARWRDIH